MSAANLPDGPEQGSWTVDALRGLEDSERYEIVDGAIGEIPDPDGRRHATTENFAEAFGRYVESNDLGTCLQAPLLVIVDDSTALRPDLVFVEADRLDEMVDGDVVSGAPDLVVEMVAESTRRRQLIDKREIYGREGVKSLLYVAPKARAVEICRRNDERLRTSDIVADEDELTLDIWPDFSVDLTNLWVD